ncbi:autotransporter outer membrane beta-barrel domain-containing protein [Mesorhizobium sp. GR13]|uniref:autotransporter family protein n=1 Tax=Mesorhizobium sp. GR13 TaxID=2562308 RepID=UPI0010BFA2A1|nr:autotransporter outer membrane beta-barrel domain-containing protein [Mesorhizobium sp. GR13]
MAAPPSGGVGPSGGAYGPTGGNGSDAVNSGDGGGGGGYGYFIGSSGGNGGNGADGGGGGGGGYGDGFGGAGGDGGLGGGGGGGSSFAGSGGNGGFGGDGGGAAAFGVAGAGGFGGGNGATAGGGVGAGGGGAAFGGAVFVRAGSTLTIRGSGGLSGGSVTGGTGANIGQAAGSGIFLNGSGTLSFDQAAGVSQTISDQIADEAGLVADGYTAPAGFTPGTWGLQKSGAGTLLLTGANSYAGNTVVDGGSLIVNGSVANSSVSVASGATVGGSGTLGDTNVLSGGTLAPGSGIGTLTVDGDLTFNGGSRYSVDLSPTDADRTDVTGIATLTGGIVVLNSAPGTYVTRNHTILNAAGGLGGTTFASLTGAQLPGLTSSLQYDTNNVYLQITANSGGNPAYSGLTSNQKAVATSLLSYFDSTGSLPAEFAALDANGLTQVSGAVATAAVSSGLHAADLFMGVISDPFVDYPASPVQQSSAPIGFAQDSTEPSSVRALAALGEETASAAETANRQLAISGAHSADALGGYASSPWTIWGAAYGGAQDIDGNAAVGSADLTTRNWGIATGFDYSIEDGKLGFALGGGGSSFSLENNLGSGNAAVFNAGIYGSKTFGNAYVSAAAAYAFNSVDTTRAVFGDTLEADYDAHTLSGRVEGGYRFDTSFAAITPYAAVQGSSYFMPDYSENSVNGGPFALSYDSQTQSALRTELGARIEHIIATETGSIKLGARLAWAWNAENARDVTSAFQSLAAPSFTIDGAEPDEHALLVGAGAEFGISDNLSAKVSFNGEFSGNVTAYGAAAKLSYKW